VDARGKVTVGGVTPAKPAKKPVKKPQPKPKKKK
jgi:hypothetical protein